ELLSLLSRLPGEGGVVGLAELALGPLSRLFGARGAMLMVRSQSEPPDFEIVGRVGECGAGLFALPASGALERALLERPRPQALGDLPEEAARECGALDAEILVPLVSKNRIAGVLAFAA